MSSNMSLIESDFNKVFVPGSIKGAMKDAQAGSRDLWQVPIGELKTVDGFNPRVLNDEYEAHIESLTQSMLTEGFFQDCPLAGYVSKNGASNEILVYSGHSRLAAAKRANERGAQIEKIPVVVNTQGLSMEDITVALIRGNGGKNLTFYESAIVCKRLVRFGLEIDDISRRTGLTPALVKNRLFLLTGPLKLREMVANNEISATLAIDMLNEHGDAVIKAIEDAKQVAEQNGKTKIRKSQTASGISKKASNAIVPPADPLLSLAPKLLSAAALVKGDAGFSGLSAETQDTINGLLLVLMNEPIAANPTPVDPHTLQLPLTDPAPVVSVVSQVAPAPDQQAPVVNGTW